MFVRPVERKRRFRSLATAVVAVFLAAPVQSFACPSCKSAIEGDPTGLAFYWSTLFLIGMPFLLVGSVGGWLFLVYGRAARQDGLPEAAWSPTSLDSPGHGPAMGKEINRE